MECLQKCCIDVSPILTYDRLLSLTSGTSKVKCFFTVFINIKDTLNIYFITVWVSGPACNRLRDRECGKEERGERPFVYLHFMVYMYIVKR